MIRKTYLASLLTLAISPVITSCDIMGRETMGVDKYDNYGYGISYYSGGSDNTGRETMWLDKYDNYGYGTPYYSGGSNSSHTSNNGLGNNSVPSISRPDSDDSSSSDNLDLSIMQVCAQPSDSSLNIAETQLLITAAFRDSLSKYEYYQPFSEGLAAVCRDRKWGYIDVYGHEVIPCQFKYDEYTPGQFSEGMACVPYGNTEGEILNERIAFIDKTGKVVLQGDFYTCTPVFASVWATVDKYLPSFNDEVCAVWDHPVGYGDYESGSVQNKCVVINKEGKIIKKGSGEYDNDDLYSRYWKRKHDYIPHERHDSEHSRNYGEFRDTIQADNGSLFVRWSVFDYSPPFPVNEVFYYVDSQGNTTLSSSDEKRVKRLLAILRIRDGEDQQNEQIRMERERSKAQQINSNPSPPASTIITQFNSGDDVYRWVSDQKTFKAKVGNKFTPKIVLKAVDGKIKVFFNEKFYGWLSQGKDTHVYRDKTELYLISGDSQDCFMFTLELGKDGNKPRIYINPTLNQVDEVFREAMYRGGINIPNRKVWVVYEPMDEGGSARPVVLLHQKEYNGESSKPAPYYFYLE